MEVGCKDLIDELATHLMIQGEGPETIVRLRSLAERARSENASGLPELIDDLLSRLGADSQAGTQYLLKHGINALHGALDTPRTSAVPLRQAALAEDAELVSDFLVEAREHLSRIEGQMLVLERDPSEMEVIHTVFRAFHTIKGLAGFLDFATVQAVAHEVETLLDLARNRKLVVNSAIVDVVLESGDFLQTELASIELALNTNDDLRVADHSALAEKVRALAIPASAPAPFPYPPPKHPEIAEEGIPEWLSFTPSEPFVASDDKLLPELLSAAGPGSMLGESTDSATVATAAAPAVSSPPSQENIECAAFPIPAKAMAAPPGAPAAQPREPARAADASSVRVETAKLDHLMDMVGEIVIAQSLIRHNQAFATATDSRLLGDLAQLARVTGEVQRATMSMRMVPIGNVFGRVERVIRDLSRKAGKQVVLETQGAETEIDKTVAEELADPLLHMIRNSVDHGIETPTERESSGKPLDAKIRLSARHQGGLVIIEIADDGRGLNSEKIRRKAEERDLIAPNVQLTEAEVFELIFAPGFSTADKVTDVSGRGVGMDVVRRNVEKLRGGIETQSILGQGTTFTLKLPLTLAIIDGLVIEVGSERYIIPISGVREIFRPQDGNLFTVEGRDEMLLVRGQLLPVIRLDQRLGILARARKPSDGLIVVVESHSRCFCLLVDDLLGKQEVVIKSLGEIFAEVSGLSGCAVLGDGRVGLILDIDGIFRGAK